MGAALYVAWAGLRWWQSAGTGFGYWNDTPGYEAVAARPLGSLDFWAGTRAPGLALAIKVTGDHAELVDLQIVVSIVAWGVLAWTVGRMVGPGWTRWLASGLVLGFACTRPVTQWDRQVLTESFALSFLALGFAAAFWFARRPTWARGAAVVVVAAAWVATRDTHALVVGMAGAALVVVAGASRARHHRLEWRVLAVGLALLVLAGTGPWSAERGERGRLSLSNVYATRVLPFPDRLEWFAARGMPDAGRLRRLAAEARAATAADGVVVVVPALALDHPDPRLREYFDWLVPDGQRLFARWLVTHPRYVLGEPFARPERAFNDLGGWRGYVPDHRALPLVDRVLFPPWPFVVVAFAAALALAARARLRTAVWWVALAGALTAVVHLGASWHFDAQEADRHTLLANVQFRVATLAALAFAVDAVARRARLPVSDAPASAAAGHGRSRRDDVRTGPAGPAPRTSPAGAGTRSSPARAGDRGAGRPGT